MTEKNPTTDATAGKLKTESLIKQLTSTSDPELVLSLYAQWANSYDSDLEKIGYVAPELAVEDFCNRLNSTTGVIYDAGCGTGIVGNLLKSRGHQQIHGADFSADMLARAGISGAYQQLEHADFSAPLGVADNSYDAIISVGVYTSRFEGDFIKEMLRILKPGGLLYFTCRPHYFESHAAEELQRCLFDGSMVSVTIERKPYILKQNTEAWYIAARSPE